MSSDPFISAKGYFSRASELGAEVRRYKEEVSLYNQEPERKTDESDDTYSARVKRTQQDRDNAQKKLDETRKKLQEVVHTLRKYLQELIRFSQSAERSASSYQRAALSIEVDDARQDTKEGARLAQSNAERRSREAKKVQQVIAKAEAALETNNTASVVSRSNRNLDDVIKDLTGPNLRKSYFFDEQYLARNNYSTTYITKNIYNIFVNYQPGYYCLNQTTAYGSGYIGRYGNYF